jgi:DNA-binding transcriptional LysR family regulator
MLPSLDQLHVFVAVVSTGSFSAAARQLRRAPSAVSYAIKGLEESLHVELFDRSGHRVALTAAGQVLVVEASETLARARALQKKALDLRQGWEADLGLVVDGAMDMKPVMRAIRGFTQRESPTRLRLTVAYLSGVSERFESDAADFMIRLDFAGAPDLMGRALPPLEMVLVTHPDHPLAGQGVRGRADLAPHVELVVPDSGSQPAPHRLFMGAAHVLTLSDFHTKRDALLMGVGFGWLPRHLCREDLATGRLEPVSFDEGNTFALLPHLVRRRDAGSGQGARLLVELLLDAVGVDSA